MACVQRPPVDLNVEFIQPHDLAEHIHTDNEYVLLDCRPVLAYNSCHISGAVNVNFTGMMKKRFMAGKIGLADLVTTEEGRKRFKTLSAHRTVVYDEDTTTIDNLTASNSVYLVVSCLLTMGQMPFLLEGGLSQFGPLHPSLCEISVPLVRSQSSLPPPIRASTPGMRDQALDWQTAPPVHVLSFLVLGSERDAKSDEVFDWFNIRYVLNVTPTCPNQFVDKGVVYKRIAVSDTGTQKLSNQFQDAFDFIEQARNDNSVILIHCMAGISRSVTLTIAYIMAFFDLSMQDAYQYVKDKRPAISPNLNFMGQLVEFERHCKENGSRDKRNLKEYEPTKSQEDVSVKLMQKIARSGSTASLSGKMHHIFESVKSVDKSKPEGTSTTVTANKPFVLKPLNPKTRRPKKSKESFDNVPPVAPPPQSSSVSHDTLENNKPLVDNDDTTPINLTPPTNNSHLLSSDCNKGVGLPQPDTNDSVPSRPKSPRQLVILSIKGEKLNLQHRMEGRSPSPSSSDRTSQTTLPENNDNNNNNNNNDINKGQS